MVSPLRVAPEPLASRPLAPPAPQRPRVSIVVSVRNEAGDRVRCLDSIEAQDYPQERIEILLVDGGSTDGSETIIEQFAAGDRRVVRLQNSRQVVAAGLNAAIRCATGDVIVRVDGHTEIARDYVRRCVERLQASGADNVGGPLRPTGTSPIGRAVAAAMRHRFGVGTARFRFARQVEEVDTVYLGAFRRDVFVRYGLFDESLVRNQDYELNYRIRRGGGKVVVDPVIHSTYRARGSLLALWRQFWSYGFWKQRMLRRNPRALRGRQIVAPALVTALLGGVLGTIVHVVDPALPNWGPWLLGGTAAVYAAAVVLATLVVAGSDRELHRTLPAVFMVMHLAWGLGFVFSLMRPQRGGPEVPQL